MSQELVPQDHPTSTVPLFNSRQPSGNMNVGAVAIEQERAIAEVQGQLILAKRFPRDLNAAYAELMESASLTAMAEQAFYSVPNRGTGLSIRSAEEIARVFGNFEFGHRELSRGDGKSEIEVYAWDKQTNNRSIRQITVMHVLDSKHGAKKLTDQTDIDNKIANVASKQVRGRIFAMMPKWLVAEFETKCKQTLAGTTSEPISVRVRKMTQAFAKYGVSDKHLVDYLGHSLDDTTLDEVVDLTGIFNALKEGAKPSDYFGAKEAEAEASASTANKLQAAAQAGAASTTRKKTVATPAPAAATDEPPAEAAKEEVTTKPKDKAKPGPEAEAKAEPEEAKKDSKPDTKVSKTEEVTTTVVSENTTEAPAESKPAAAEDGDLF